jgi:hypothetical protein
VLLARQQQRPLSFNFEADRAATERAKEVRKAADRFACEAWNKRMCGFRGPAQPSPTLGDALNVGHLYLEVRCLGCDTHQTVALDVVRRPKTTRSTSLSGTAVHGLLAGAGLCVQRSHLVALWQRKIFRE